MKYRNKKTGGIYRKLAMAIDCTNNRNTMVVVYCPDDNEHSIYVREEAEFEQKFEVVE